MNLHCIIHSFLQVYILGLLHERWWVLFQVEYYIALTCMQYPKGHVSYCYQVAYINFSHFHLLLKNHWTNMNQTYILSCDSVTSNNTLSWYTSIWSNFDLWVSEATFNNISVISWGSVLLVEEMRGNHLPVASHRQTLSQNVVLSTLCHEWKSNSQLQWWETLIDNNIFDLQDSELYCCLMLNKQFCSYIMTRTSYIR